jgi:hypothetical protein
MPTDKQTRMAALLRGVRTGLGVPGIAVFASMFGFGAFAKAAGLDLALALAATLGIWAMPGQVVFAETYPTGSAVVVFLAVFFANARFFPLAVATLPLLAGARGFRWLHLAVAHLISVISWSHMVLVASRIPQPERMPYFVGFALTMMSIAAFATVSGYLAADAVPKHLALVFLIIPALYFILTAASARTRMTLLAALFGGIAVPSVEILLPGWGLVIGGVGGGSIAYAIDAAWRARHG